MHASSDRWWLGESILFLLSFALCFIVEVSGTTTCHPVFVLIVLPCREPLRIWEFDGEAWVASVFSGETCWCVMTEGGENIDFQLKSILRYTFIELIAIIINRNGGRRAPSAATRYTNVCSHWCVFRESEEEMHSSVSIKNVAVFETPQNSVQAAFTTLRSGREMWMIWRVRNGESWSVYAERLLFIACVCMCMCVFVWAGRREGDIRVRGDSKK